MIQYDTNYLNKFIANNNLKDRLAMPMIKIIKSKIELNECRKDMQEKNR